MSSPAVTPSAESSVESSVAPAPLGRRVMKVVGLLLLANVGVIVAAALLDQDVPGLFVFALAATGWILGATSGIVFLVHTFTHASDGVGRAMRRSATGSGLALLVLGFMGVALQRLTADLMMPISVGSFSYLGYFCAALGVGVIARAWTARTTADPSERFVFRHRRTTRLALFLALIVLIMLPKFSGGSVSSAYRSQLISDLQNLVRAQEDFFADSARYASAVGSLRGYRSSPDQPVPVITVDAEGWSATLTHDAIPGTVCGVAVNAPNPVRESAMSGEAVCQ